ncbi:tyrosine-type recombinase/integrase [Rhodococcus pyridinivorans]|uniref:tyrosine-type recombinase/integrase n=1 Tax=Rhodococcus pyridinivorans TaxID=103816 RepID=UPI00110EA0FF|nr:site-specific integrase [Rhodococcus pyridinivorans]
MKKAARDPIVREHVAYLRLRNRRPVTIRSRARLLDALFDYLGKPLLHATEDDLERWQNSLRVTASSLGTYTTHARAFYTWAYERDLTDTNLARALVVPRVPRRQPRPISEKDLSTALLCSTNNPQLRMWLILAAYCGLRAGEVAAINRSDVRIADDGGAFLLVHGKGGNERVVRMPPMVLAELKSFLRSNGPLFRRPSGTPWPADQLSRQVSIFFGSIGMDWTLHCLRHRYAARLVDIGADVRDVQALLGHASLSTTTVYLSQATRHAASSVDLLSNEMKTPTLQTA